MLSPKAQTALRTLASNSIASALVISFLLHLFAILGVELGRGLGFWETSLIPPALRSNLIEEVQKVAQQRAAQAQQQQAKPPIELQFVEIDPSQATEEAPKNATHYSTQNTRASNPDPEEDRDIPKIDGRQTQVPRTMDTLKPDPKALERPYPLPSRETMKPAPQPPPKEAPPASKPAQPKVEQEGEMLVAKAAPKSRPEVQPDNPEPPPRPRTLAEARAQKGLMAGESMKQDGGVRRNSLASNLDTIASPFGAYDAAFIAAVQSRWYNLLDQRDFVRGEAGKVVLHFRLNRDGRITDIRVAEQTVPEMLAWMCQRAVLDNVPYAPFPSKMRAELGRDFRDVTFTFYYNN